MCCDVNQIDALTTQVEQARTLLSRCPSCYYNFVNLFCQSTCSPFQYQFLRPEYTKRNAEGKEYIVSVEYYVNPDFTDGLIGSCAHVFNPQTSEPAFSAVCGVQYIPDCTHDNLYEMLGSNTSSFVPFQIDFHDSRVPITLGNTTYTPMNGTIVPCSEAPTFDTVPCSSGDCEACYDPYPAPKSHKCKVGALSCFALVGLVVFVAVTCVFLFTLLLHGIISKGRVDRGNPATTAQAYMAQDLGNQEKDTHLVELTPMEKLRATWERFMKDTCACWGLVCYRHPYLVFFYGVAVAAICGGGFKFLDVTTDPVELWSSPSSRARVEKDYFDEHFGKFYRVEQLIILPDNQSTFDHEDPALSGTVTTITWGPVFRKRFLQQVVLHLSVSD